MKCQRMPFRSALCVTWLGLSPKAKSVHAGLITFIERSAGCRHLAQSRLAGTVACQAKLLPHHVYDRLAASSRPFARIDLDREFDQASPNTPPGSYRRDEARGRWVPSLIIPLQALGSCGRNQHLKFRQQPPYRLYRHLSLQRDLSRKTWSKPNVRLGLFERRSGCHVNDLPRNRLSASYGRRRLACRAAKRCPRSFTGAGHDAHSRPSSSLLWNGWIGSTTGGSWSPLETFRRPKSRNATTLC